MTDRSGARAGVEGGGSPGMPTVFLEAPGSLLGC